MLMLMLNHTVTGVFIGLSLDQPAAAFPVGLASHLALDLTPHFGPDPKPEIWERDPFTLIVAGIDFAASVAITVGAVMAWPHHAASIIAGVAGAVVPDFAYVPLTLFGKDRVYRLVRGYRQLIDFLTRIQWYERPPGILTEAAWFTVMVGALWSLRGLG